MPVERVTFDEPPIIEDSVEFEVELPEEPLVEFEDGSMGIEAILPPEPPEFNANLADTLPEDELRRLGKNLLEDIENDKLSRRDWEEGYEKGLNLLGLKQEEMTLPWPGACGLYHTMVTEAIVRFQSNAIMEIFPPSGPVKADIIGKITAEIEKQAQRVTAEMNYQLVEKMEDYRPETEKLLWGLAASGAAFRKLYPDPITGRPCALYVPAQDFIVPYGAQSLKKASRYTQRFKLSKGELKKLQFSGFYREAAVEEADPSPTELEAKIDEINREDPPPYDNADVDLMECHTDLDFEDQDGIARPYIVTLDDMGTVIGLYRNWEEGDPHKEKIIWFVEYSYIPGMGFYGYGLLHLIGGSAKAATSILRQLIDAGTLSNLPGGFKSTALRSKGDTTPLRPGEWRDMDMGGQKLSEAFLPLPYKEPSAVLLALSDKVVEEGRRLGSIADVEIGDVSAQAPVGTTLAIMDRAMKVMSAVQARLHNSMRLEFRILAKLIRDSTPETYDYEVDGPREIKRSDFDRSIDVLPVSDPNAATLPQRVTQYQSAIQMSSTAPQIYNLPLLHRKMLDVLGIRDARKIVPDPEEMAPLDQLTENMMLLKGQPIKVFESQPHEQHMVILDSFIKDPKTAAAVGQNPQAQAIFAAAQSHYAEHYGFLYRIEIEKQLGSPLPPLGEPLPGDIESLLSIAVAEAAKRLLAKNQQEAAAQEAQAKAQDPVVQMQIEEVKIKKQDVAQKPQIEQMRVQADLQKAAEREKTERERIRSNERLAEEAAIDKNEQFLAELKQRDREQAATNEKIMVEMREMFARIAEINARTEQIKKEPAGDNPRN